MILTAGYVAVWLGFALAAASLQWVLARAGLLDGGSVGRLVGGTIVIGAGALSGQIVGDSEKEPVPQRLRKAPRVLVVDDEARNVKLLGRQLLLPLVVGLGNLFRVIGGHFSTLGYVEPR